MPDIVVTITFSPESGVSVFGPLQDYLLMYGLLSSAKDIVQQYHSSEAAKAREQRVLLAPAGAVPPPRLG